MSKLIGLGILAATSAPVFAGEEIGISAVYNSYGYPGLIDMPVADSRPDGELAFTVSSFAGQTRNTLTFQVLPRLSGSFRYSILDNVTRGGTGRLYDRSFSLQYRFADEGRLRPALAIGLNDFLGTGVYASEYVVATKTLGNQVRVTGGIGWGRLAGVGGVNNPLTILDDGFKTRAPRDFGQGGDVEAGQFFRGDAALFGGVEWQAGDRLRLTAEYSSDAYPRETPAAFSRRSQINFGANYKLRPGMDLALQYLHGDAIGVQVTSTLNPMDRPAHAGRDPAPPPVLAREASPGDARSWEGHVAGQDERLRVALDRQGVRLNGFEIDDAVARVGIENTAYALTAQAVGRTARVLSRQLPAEVTHFDITLVTGGIPVTELRISRDDMETLEHDLQANWKSFARARIRSPDAPLGPAPGRHPRFDWAITPYVSPSLFDPDAPVRADLGAQLDATYEPAPGLEFSASLRKKVIGNLDESSRVSDSVLPHVRSDFSLYDEQGDPALTRLTAAYYFTSANNLYGRATVGYLERMYGGVSSELLWKPNDSPFALGIEVNHVRQRDFDQLFSFRDYEVTTGHVSAYWDMGNGFHAQADAGRYLAGDWGATFTLDRAFNNGWRIGAFATLTDVPFEQFGEGSFDKGIRITVPISWLSGEPTRDSFSTTVRPLTRDGGARLEVDGRLYERVRPLHKPALRDGWGRFWR